MRSLGHGKSSNSRLIKAGVQKEKAPPKPSEGPAAQSPDLLETLFHEAPLGIAIGGADTKLIRVNPALCRLLGYTESELLGKTFRDITHPDDIPRSEIHAGNILSGRYPLQYTKRLLRKDGTTILTRITNSIVRKPDGSLDRSFGLAEDVTRQDQLEHKQAQLAAIVESSTDGIFSLSLSSTIETWNRGAEKLYGYSSAEAIGNSVFLLNAGASRGHGALHDAVEKAKGGVSTSGMETSHCRKDGKRIPISLTVSPIRNEFQQVEGISLIAHDMTDFKRAITALRVSEEQTRRSSENLSRMNKELEQFAFVASHDLQEPLRTISCFLQLLEKRQSGKLDQQSDEYIKYAVQGAKRMQRLILDLLQFSRTTRYSDELKPVSLGEVLDHAVSNLQGLVEAHNVKIEREPLPLVLSFDRQLTQVFQNLISNAIKFRSTAAPLIRISAERKGREWIVKVSDNGIGFNTEHAERIFLIFQRLHTWEEYPGTGVGLAICKKIIEAHGGKIWAESKAGNGSTFFFSLQAVDNSLGEAIETKQIEVV